jgi:uncharacterized surface protein with fasciclin (FAS1) repeats
MKLLQNIKRLFVPIFIIGLISMVGCEKNDVASLSANPSSSILDKVSADANFSLLKEAVIKAALVDTFGKTPGAFTVFAPDNTAFTAAGITSSSIATSTPASLKTLLLYHTLSGVVTFSTGFQTATNTKLITASGDSIFVTKKANGNIFVNGVLITLADIGTVNGVVHKVGRVIKPAIGSIYATAQAAGLDSLVRAIQLVNAATLNLGGDSSLIPTLNTSLLTAFAPSNTAFTQLLQSLALTNLNQVPLSQLKAILKFHLTSGRLFSSEFVNGNITMVGSGSATINLTNGANGGVTIKGNGNGINLCNVVAIDIMCRNGVVHVIDRVLLP